jgi:hypothetical protein
MPTTTQAAHIIAKFGTRASMARAMGHKNPTTVQRWDESGSIPEKYWEEIIEAGRRATPPVEITPEDFVAHLKDKLTPSDDPTARASV